MSDEATTEAEGKKPLAFIGEPWEQQPGESNKAFEAFRKYRDYGPKRSCAKVGEELGKSTTLMERWSSAWKWVRRSEMYDQEQDRQYRIDVREQARELAKQQIQQAGYFKTVAIKALKKKFGESFEKITAKSLASGELLRFWTEAIKIERTALGEPETIQEQQITAGNSDNDRKPFVPLAYAGRIDEALALLETARARQANGTNGEPN